MLWDSASFVNTNIYKDFCKAKAGNNHVTTIIIIFIMINI